MPSLPPLLWLTISGLFFAAGEYLSKRYVLTPGWPLLAFLVCMYVLGTLAWLPALAQMKSLSVAGTLWSVISLGMTVLIGVLVFHERLTALQTTGIVLAAASIVALSWH
ncbi:MAG: hypothetical protein PHW10_02510 [Candidatus Peribacteraceae bacterium]|nr:hypothetical protein [Candidatus Peribacteraceae bacterium]